MTDPQKTQSHAYGVLRASARRVLIAQGGGVATIYVDQFEHFGSRRVYRPALSELHAVGLIDVTR